MEYYFKTMESPVGKLTLIASGKSLSSVLWENEDTEKTGIGFRFGG